MLVRCEARTSLVLEGLDSVGGVGWVEGLESLGSVSGSVCKLSISGEISAGSAVSIDSVDSLEGLGGVESLESLDGLVVPSASSSICRIGETGREI